MLGNTINAVDHPVRCFNFSKALDMTTQHIYSSPYLQLYVSSAHAVIAPDAAAFFRGNVRTFHRSMQEHHHSLSDSNWNKQKPQRTCDNRLLGQ